MNVGFVSLGCSKNLVDTEIIMGVFKEKGYKIVNQVEDSEIIVVNTCGFIGTAKEEAVNTILEMAEYKNHGKCKYLIALGCMVKRYKEDLIKSIPEVDLFLGTDEYNDIWQKIGSLIQNNEAIENIDTSHRCNDFLNRVITTGETTAYLKIAEGCSNKCTYCAIPYIRGEYISRPVEEVVQEAQILANRGIKELIIIAQDTTKYGIDLYGKSILSELLAKLCDIENIKWVRFLYSYPESITEDLIEIVKTNNKICSYFDIPIQHISEDILKRMNRKSDSKSIKNVIDKIRKEIPNVVLRTSLIVGFPGETEKDFEELKQFVQWAKFDKLGVFEYSKEDGTPAEKFKNHIHHNTKKKRKNIIMTNQQKISREKLKNFIGKQYEVLIEGITGDKKYYIARSYMDVPEIDGYIYVKNTKNMYIGDFMNCKICDVIEYDLIAE